MILAKQLQRAKLTVACVGVAVLAFASTASAFSPRAPQVVFSSAALQGYLNGVDGGVNVLTDQLDAQTFATSVSGNTDFTLMVKLTGDAPQNSVGVYNTLDPSATPALFQLFPAAAAAGWSVFCHFASTGQLTVALYDNSVIPVLQGSTTYTGVDRTHFGFYLQNTGGTYYSQDGRNGQKPQALTYAGTGINYGEWWECLEDNPFTAASTFTGAVLQLQSVIPTPVAGKTWGQLKATYR